MTFRLYVLKMTQSQKTDMNDFCHIVVNLSNRTIRQLSVPTTQKALQTIQSRHCLSNSSFLTYFSCKWLLTRLVNGAKYSGLFDHITPFCRSDTATPPTLRQRYLSKEQRTHVTRGRPIETLRDTSRHLLCRMWHRGRRIAMADLAKGVMHERRQFKVPTHLWELAAKCISVNCIPATVYST